MATTLRASSSNSATSGTAISVSAPTGTTTGDLVTIFVHVNTDTTIVDNNGGTSFTEDLNDYQPNPTYGHTVSVFSRRILVGDPGTYSFTSGGTGRWSIVAATWQNPNASTIYDATLVSSNSGDANADPFTVTGITTATDNSIHVVMGALDDGVVTVANNPAGYTTIQNTANQPMGVSYKVITPAGATGGKDVDFSGASACIGVSLAIKDIGSVAITTSISTMLMMGV